MRVVSGTFEKQLKTNIRQIIYCPFLILKVQTQFLRMLKNGETLGESMGSKIK